MRVSKIFVTVDIVAIKNGIVGDSVLLIQRKNAPYQNFWALPGGFVDEGEDLADAASRELFEETGIKAPSLEQIGAFGKANRDPRGHTVAVAYLCRLPDSIVAIAGDDAADAKWFSVNDLPKLAFDHAEIISFAQTKI